MHVAVGNSDNGSRGTAFEVVDGVSVGSCAAWGYLHLNGELVLFGYFKQTFVHSRMQSRADAESGAFAQGNVSYHALVRAGNVGSESNINHQGDVRLDLPGAGAGAAHGGFLSHAGNSVIRGCNLFLYQFLHHYGCNIHPHLVVSGFGDDQVVGKLLKFAVVGDNVSDGYFLQGFFFARNADVDPEVFHFQLGAFVASAHHVDGLFADYPTHHLSLMMDVQT
ncbi:MAG: hypothetical protein BWX83_01227 [Candidatus Cloacimonetes bacterium ADurb.Bin117]|nr:MAG: hypothetical protein BWX83_01227 [Candidatus Cloacimonetes bacterium ADurb.Bin117]